jgi:hypothetical protein
LTKVFTTGDSHRRGGLSGADPPYGRNRFWVLI